MKSYRAIAEYYDHENERLAWLQRDVPFFLKQLPKKRQSVLELGCGTARAAVPIAQAGHRVVGVDYAKDMLAIATRKRDAVGLRERELELLHGDVLELDLGRTFDWVACFFNTFMGFSTLPQQDAFLATVRRHMKRNGRFWLDIFQPNLPLLAAEESKDLTPTIFYVPRYERTVFMTVDVKRDPAKQLQRITFNYTWFDKSGRERRQRTVFDGTFIFPRELQILLERNGFRIERIYGDHDASPLDADSPRIIARCRLS